MPAQVTFDAPEVAGVSGELNDLEHPGRIDAHRTTHFDSELDVPPVSNVSDPLAHRTSWNIHLNKWDFGQDAPAFQVPRTRPG